MYKHLKLTDGLIRYKADWITKLNPDIATLKPTKNWSSLFRDITYYISDNSVLYQALPDILQYESNNKYGGKITSNVKALLRTIPSENGYVEIVEQRFREKISELTSLPLETYLRTLDSYIDKIKNEKPKMKCVLTKIIIEKLP